MWAETAEILAQSSSGLAPKQEQVTGGPPSLQRRVPPSTASLCDILTATSHVPSACNRKRVSRPTVLQNERNDLALIGFWFKQGTSTVSPHFVHMALLYRFHSTTADARSSPKVGATPGCCRASGSQAPEEAQVRGERQRRGRTETRHPGAKPSSAICCLCDLD